MKYFRTFILTLPIIFILVSTACKNKGSYRYYEGMIWNTSFHITYKSDRNLNDSIDIILKEIGKSLSVFDSTSIVSRVNRSSQTPVDRMFKDVYTTSLRIWKESNGAFDPTISPLITAWGFGKGHKPAENIDIDSLLKIVGIDKTFLRNDTLFKTNPKTEFNFSAIAKGYGCDKAGEILKRNGVDSYLVEIGGEIACSGNNPKGNPWGISIDKPIESREERHSSQAVIKLHNGGIATSGNYRNFHKGDKGNFGHTIDVKTGRPAENDILSATIICSDAMQADAYATACMAMGSEKAKTMISSLNLAAMLILTDSSIWTSPSFKKYMK